MTTTAQQKVTRADALAFADEAFRNRDITFSQRDVVDMVGALGTFLSRHRLASVSSASAEPVAWCSPGQLANLMDVDVDGGVYLPIRKTERGNFTMPLYAASPEPVPATNQAGEVERSDDEVIAEFAFLYRAYGLYPDDKLAPDALELKRKVLAAIATQPATSQEDEARVASIRKYLATIGMTKHVSVCREDMEWILDRFPVCDPDAATPTPPTLSEDLRALIVVTDGKGFVTLHEPNEEGNAGDLVASVWRHDWLPVLACAQKLES